MMPGRSLMAGLVFAIGCSPAPEPAGAPGSADVAGPASEAAAARFPSGAVVDLSHPYDAQAVYWPTAAPFRLDTVADGMTPGGFYYAANNFSTSEHGGTHIDAPVHFAQGRQHVDEIPLDRLMGEVAVIDVTPQSAANPDFLVTTDDISAWERANGELPRQAIVLIRTGFSARWPDAARYLGTAERGEAAVSKLHFPGVHPDAARWLIANRSVKAVGIDTASIDYGQSSQFETHRALFERDVPAFENLTALDRLPPRGALIVALPMKIRGGSGAPLRVAAILPR
jgi:kynurenine formamidase